MQVVNDEDFSDVESEMIRVDSKATLSQSDSFQALQGVPPSQAKGLMAAASTTSFMKVEEEEGEDDFKSASDFMSESAASSKIERVKSSANQNMQQDMISDDTSMQRGGDVGDATSYSQSEMVRVVEDVSESQFTEDENLQGLGADKAGAMNNNSQKSELKRIGGQMEAPSSSSNKRMRQNLQNYKDAKMIQSQARLQTANKLEM